MEIVIILVVFLATVFIILFSHYLKKISIQKQIETSWGKEINKFRDFSSIKSFVELETPENSYNLTEQTLIDIDIENVFSFIDRTQTTIGQQFLFLRLVAPSLSIEELEKRRLIADFFLKQAIIRKKTCFQLFNLEKTGTQLILKLLNAEAISLNTKYSLYYKVLTLLSCLSLIICFFFPIFFVFTIFLGFLNMLIHLIFRANNSEKLKAIRQLFQLQKTIVSLSNLNIPIENNSITIAKKNLKKFSNIYHFLDFGIPLNDLSSVVFYLLDVIKSFFLIEVHLLNFCHNEILKNKMAIYNYFNYVGQIEMALSTASLFSDSSIKITTPTISKNENSISFSEIAHPLILDCIVNSLEIEEKNIFITGSNMSGKSTFLRAILINSILSQTINLCFASSYKSPIIKVSSSIKIGDDLLSGKSYYFEEVNIIHEMVLKSSDEIPNLFIVDEIFKGTNTLERIALAYAILKNLSLNKNFVIASSHDIELIELLEENFNLYHFTETIVNNRLFFDHKIKLGGLKSKNAIKIIEMIGFPIEIVSVAKKLAFNQ